MLITLLGEENVSLLDQLDPEVFDKPIEPRWLAEFIVDPRHHLALAVHEGRVVGMASAVHYVHPDKPPELWIVEVGVADESRRQGAGRMLVQALIDHGRTLGCATAWVIADQANTVAHRLYASVGGRKNEEPAVIFEWKLGSMQGEADRTP